MGFKHGVSIAGNHEQMMRMLTNKLLFALFGAISFVRSYFLSTLSEGLWGAKKERGAMISPTEIIAFEVKEAGTEEFKLYVNLKLIFKVIFNNL